MNKNLLRELKKLGDADFCCLEHHIHIARVVRKTIGENGLTYEQMAAELGVNDDDMISIVTGAYPFDLRFISKLEAFRQHLFDESEAYKKETDVIQFAQYKYQLPGWMGKMDEILKMLNSEQNPERSVATEADSSNVAGQQTETI